MNIYKKFESLTAFENYLQVNETQDAFKAYQSSQRQENEHGSYYTTTTWEKAEELLLHGDKVNAEKIERCGISKERLKIRLTANRRQIFCDVSGFAPHVPNYIAGVPTAMLNSRQIKVKQKVVTLVYNISANGDVNAEDVRDVAIKMLSAIMRVEASGVRINLYVCDISDSSRQQIGWLVRIKSSGQHLDVLKTAYPLTNPSMQRRHSFRFTEITKGVHKSFAYGYGSANRRADELLKACGLRDAITLSYYTMSNKDVNGIVEMILGGK